MSYKQTPQKFNATIAKVEIGSKSKVELGGENVLPFYTFDAAIENAPRIGVEVSDIAEKSYSEGLKEYYATTDAVEMAKKAEAIPGADFVVLRLEGADPTGDNKSVAECVELAKAVAAAITKPLMIAGCKNVEKDTQLFTAIAEALSGENVVLLSAREEDYKQVAVSAVQAYNQKIGAESAVDINLAKQLNTLIGQLGIANGNYVMNIGSAAAGYGFEYVATTLQRVKMAALSQNDASIQAPIVTPVSFETWTVKESVVSEAEAPEGWGSLERRGVNMEITTAAACLAAGSDAVILRHPESVGAISKLIKELI